MIDGVEDEYLTPLILNTSDAFLFIPVSKTSKISSFKLVAT